MAGPTGNSRAKVVCPCCKKPLHPSTVRKHLTGNAPATYLASHAADDSSDEDRTRAWDLQADARPVKRFRARRSPSQSPSPSKSGETPEVAGSSGTHGREVQAHEHEPLDEAQAILADDAAPPHAEDNLGDHGASDGMDLAVEFPAAGADVWVGRTRYRPPTVEDELDEGDVPRAQLDAEEGTMEIDYSLEDRDAQYEAISAWDELAESLILEGLISGMFCRHMHA